VVLRRQPGARAGFMAAASAMPRAVAQRCGADPADLESAALRPHARATETGADAARRVLHCGRRRGPRPFAVRFGRYQLTDGRGPFIGCEPAPSLPPEAIAVLGLDRRRWHARISASAHHVAARRHASRGGCAL
jgi:hypothetical protein